MKPKILVIAGATASGKTLLAIALAKKIPIEVVSADGLQVFRKMDIGTAKPPLRIRENIPHHLIDILNPDEPITSAWFAEKAREAIDSISDRKKIPVVVGGSGFYLKALERPPVALPSFQTASISNEEGYKLIQDKDPDIAIKIHPNDSYRISRAVSLIRKGIRPSKQWELATEQTPPFEIYWVGIDWERSLLHQRINDRVSGMFANGLLEETASILKEFPNSRERLKKTIGYQQALQHLEGKCSLDQALILTQQATRQYAKRQLTWFRKEKRINWVSHEEAFDKAISLVGNMPK